MRYATICADPPWSYAADTRRTFADRGGETAVLDDPYDPMPVEEIAGLPVRQLAAKDAHAYLWTTQRYLRDALWVVEAWGFTLSKILTWAKAPRGFMLGGTFGSCTEFALFARRGDLPALSKVPRDWFTWPRPGNLHSAKPPAFYDLVEQVSPGPRLELFARRQRLGWDTWGDQALEHVDASSRVALVR